MRVVAPEAAQTSVRSTPGGDLELVVHLSRPGTPVRWYKDGERLASQGRVQLEQAGARQVLRVRGARRGDAGEYLCDAPQDSRIFIVSVEGNHAPLIPTKTTSHPLDPFHLLYLTQLLSMVPTNAFMTVTVRGHLPFFQHPSIAGCIAQWIKRRTLESTCPGCNSDLALWDLGDICEAILFP